MNNLAVEVYKGLWLIELEAGLAMLYTFLQNKDREITVAKIGQEEVNGLLLQGGFVVGTNEKSPFCVLPQSASLVNLNDRYALASAPAGSVAILPVRGAITKYDQSCGPSGTKTKSSQLMQAYNSPNISAIVMIYDTPGGSADGTEEFAATVGEVGKNKPVIGLADGLCASAGYWAYSASTERWAVSSNTIVGSIGTMFSLSDIRPALEAQGIKLHEIYASDSTDKNDIFREAFKGNYDPLRMSLLNPFNATFTGTVKKNLKGKIDLKKENVLTGKTYMAGDSIQNGYGLVDRIGSLSEAVNHALELANSRKSKPRNSSNTNMSIKFTKLTALFGGLLAMATGAEKVEASVEDAEKAEQKLETDFVAKADFDAIQTKLTAAESSVTSLTQAKTDLTTKLEASDKKVSDLTTEVDGLKSKIPGANPTSTTKQKDDAPGANAIDTRPKNSWELKAERQDRAYKSEE